GKSTIKQIEAFKEKEAMPSYSQTELDLLQNLSKRRDELGQRERDFDLKSKVLEASEKRLDDKVIEIRRLQIELNKIVAKYNEKQSTEIKSLVKIYENMKPGDAANIFNQMDLPILLEVIDKMSERKVAPVLAAMDPKKAKDVTQELAEMRRSITAAVPGAAAPAP
ncbi:MAG: MotE family protein, partial [Rickettsiales bacterium]